MATTTLTTLADPITLSAAGRLRLPRRTVAGYGEVMDLKDALPMSLSGIRSLRDFGGCYLVHGRYLLNTARHRRLSLASMVDVNPLPEFLAAAARIEADHPGTRVEVVHGDFREPRLFDGLAPTDAALLYEVLLHQDNYVEVMKNVCRVTTRFVCVAQPCLREELCTLPSSAVLLQFLDEALKDRLRTDSFWPKEPRTDQFTTAHWMWGQTTSHLVDVMGGLGWRLAEGAVVDDVCGPCWEYPLLVFTRR